MEKTEKREKTCGAENFFPLFLDSAINFNGSCVSVMAGERMTAKKLVLLHVLFLEIVGMREALLPLPLLSMLVVVAHLIDSNPRLPHGRRRTFGFLDDNENIDC